MDTRRGRSHPLRQMLIKDLEWINSEIVYAASILACRRSTLLDDFHESNNTEAEEADEDAS